MLSMRRLGPCVLAVLLAPAVVSGQSATLSGVVRSETQSAVRGAFVTIPSLELSTATNDQGRYRLTIPAERASERVVLAVSSIGYRDVEIEVQLRSGEVTQDVTMTESAIALDELVVSGTAGRRDRRAQTAAVATIDAARISEVAPVQSVANLLQARTPGVMLRSVTGSSGTGQVIRVRGQASIELANNPLIFVDGVRADAGSGTGNNVGNNQEFGVGGAMGSRLNDIKLEDIESIEVVKGPAAATLYGSDAAAGVINVVTKRGRRQGGFTQTLTLEYGEQDPNFTPPDNFARCVGGNMNQAGCQSVAEGTVLADNPLLRTNAFGDGRIRNAAWSLRGGAENYDVFFSLGADDENGTLPNNRFSRVSSRATFGFVPNEQLRIELGFWLGRTITRLPNNDNNIFGWLGGGFLGSPATVGGANDGWFGAFRTDEAIGSLENFDKATRLQPRLSVQYTPFNWFTHRFQVGADIVRTRAFQLFPKNDIGWFDSADQNSGQIAERRRSEDRITIDYLGNITWFPVPALRGDFAFGTQITTHTNDQTTATGIDLINNDVREVSAAAIRTGQQTFEEDRQIGFFGQTTLALNEKLFLEAGGRIDRASIFGADSEVFVSPSVGLSWLISDEPFFESAIGPSAITTLKLRGKWGASGKQPTTGFRTTFDPNPFAIVSDVRNGVTAQNPGNPDLRPERSSEIEVGFDAGLLNDRLGLELTFYRKKTTDLVVEQDLPGSLGFDDGRLVNLGEVLNRGFEVSANARVLTYENLALEFHGAVNTLHNEILNQGGIPSGTAQARDTTGFPIGSIWDYRILEIDTENDRVIVSKDREFIGNPQNLPGWETTFSSTLTLFGALGLHAGFDARGDYWLLDSTTEFRDRQSPRSEIAIVGNQRDEDGKLIDTGPFSEQEVLRRFGPFFTEDGDEIDAQDVDTPYRQEGKFLRLREIFASYQLPASFIQRYVPAQSAQVTFGMRNVSIWTDYRGLDPETGQFLTVPQDRRWTVSLNVTF